MKLSGSILTVVCFYALLCSVAMASGPPVWAEVSGNTVFLKTNTPNSPKYTCNYTLSVTFTDGKSTTVRGQTDPPTGGRPITASTRSFQKRVKSADASWDCSVIR